MHMHRSVDASMRPRLLHLGSRKVGLFDRPTITMASMRPRLLHLGSSALVAVAIAYRIPASMRPRLLHLGSGEKPKPLSVSSTRFNEAEAFTPRIPVRLLKKAVNPPTASMRPRLLHLGSGAGRRRHRLPNTRFNEAEAFTPRIPVTFGSGNLILSMLQ